MKSTTRIGSLGLFIFSLSLTIAFAQAPEKMSYQAVVVKYQVNTLSTSDKLQDSITQHGYDYMGNPIQLSKTDDVAMRYTWAYVQTKYIAKIDNTTYQDLSAYVLNTQKISNTVPLIGISSTTYPRFNLGYAYFKRLVFFKVA